MSLPRIASRLPIWTITPRQCSRSISSSSNRRDDTDILSILPSSRSPSQSHPSNNSKSPQQRDRSSSKNNNGLAAFGQRLMGDKTRTDAATLERTERTDAFTKQIYRRYNSGDVYAPHDLSGAEQKKWKYGRSTPQTDAFDVLGINPVNEYKNYTIMSEFMTEMGRIKHSKVTGLRPVNQRRVAKAIRRAIGLGLMPSVHRHPLVLQKAGPTRFL